MNVKKIHKLNLIIIIAATSALALATFLTDGFCKSAWMVFINLSSIVVLSLLTYFLKPLPDRAKAVLFVT